MAEAGPYLVNDLDDRINYDFPPDIEDDEVSIDGRRYETYCML